MTHDFTTLRVEERDDRMLVRLHRPEVRNAINQQMVDELHLVCAELAAAALVDRIAAADPLATMRAKRVFHAPRSAHPQVDNETQAELFESPAKFARMDAFLAKRKARP